MYFSPECPKCKKIHKIEDMDYYLNEEDDNYREDPHLCWDCYREEEDQKAIKVISDALDNLSEEQRDRVIDLLEKVMTKDKDYFVEQGCDENFRYSFDEFLILTRESKIYHSLIKNHFGGFDGLRAWGLW
jgi:hypothetical protein